MADISDVENTLVGVVATAIFPGQTYLPGAYATSASGIEAKIYRGWPESANLDVDLGNGYSHVSIFAEQGVSRLTTRYPLEWRISTLNVPTVTATVSGQTVTLGGTAGVNQVIGISWGVGSLHTGAAYALLATDTLASVAAGLAAAITGATSSGPVVTLPSTCIAPAAYVVSDQLATMEIRRQTQRFRISCWCPTPAIRDTIASSIDNALAGLIDAYGNLTEFIQLSDAAQSSARIQYATTYVDDKPDKDGVWRRDLCYVVEYATHLTNLQPEAIFTAMSVTARGNLVTRVGTVHP